MRKMVPMLLLSAILLQGCGVSGRSEPEIRVVERVRLIRPQIPPGLRHCPPLPEIPDPATATQADTADLLASYEEALGECIERHRSLVRVIEGEDLTVVKKPP